MDRVPCAQSCQSISRWRLSAGQGLHLFQRNFAFTLFQVALGARDDLLKNHSHLSTRSHCCALEYAIISSSLRAALPSRSVARANFTPSSNEPHCSLEQRAAPAF